MADNKITLKEVFERVVALETKLDMKSQNDIVVARRFKGFTYIIIGIQVVNLIINYLLYLEFR